MDEPFTGGHWAGPRDGGWHGVPPGPRPVTPPGRMRVSDAERAQVTDALCRHYADGRLDEAEFNERAERAAAAKTADDLWTLLADLPPSGSTPTSGPRAPGPAGGAAPQLRRCPLLVMLGVAVLTALLVHGLVLAPGPWVPWWMLAAAIVVWRRSRGHHHWHHGR